MNKVSWKPGTMIYPAPAVLVSCGSVREEFNIITISWTGTICTEPPLCYISVRPQRYSYDIIKRNQAFVINLTTRKLAYATDWCGVKSGREVDKFKEMRLTPGQAQKVKAPLIVESPVNLECQVQDIKPLGTHDMFLAEIVAVHADNAYIHPATDRFDLLRAEPICYVHGQYCGVGKSIGKFGFSVEKRKAKNRRRTGS